MKHGTNADANFLNSVLDRCSGNDVMLSATDGEEETFGRAFAAGMTPFGLFELVRRG